MEFFLRIYAWIIENWKLILKIAPVLVLIWMYMYIPRFARAYYNAKEALRLVFTTRFGFILGIIILLVWAYFNFYYVKIIPD